MELVGLTTGFQASKKTLTLQDFACVADAIAAAEKLLTKMKWR